MKIGLGIGIGAGGGAAPWTPLALGSSLALWLRADMGITLNGATVSAWADQSGRGGHFSQGTAAVQPDFVASGLNGLPSVDFNGTSKFLASTLLSSALGNHLVIAVLDVDSVAPNRYVFDSQTGRIVTHIAHASTANGLGYVDGAFRSVGALPTTGTQLVEWDLRASPGGRVYINGTQAGAAATYTQRALGGTTTIGATMPSGTSNWFDGRISELLVISGQTDEQRALVRRYIASRYGITVA